MASSDVMIAPSQKQTLEIRVQNICCSKEAILLKTTLDETPGILTVSVNVIGRRAFITYDADEISPTDIVQNLNDIHLGASLVGDGSQDEDKFDRREVKLFIKAANITLMSCLFIALCVAKFRKLSYMKWIAIPILILGGIPLFYKIYIDMRRRIFISINILMLVAVFGALALSDWLDACLIVFIYDIASFVEAKSKQKVEKYIGALMMTYPEEAVLAETNETVPVKSVPYGTLILITAGERIPLDGDVTAGKAAVDESSLTGEAQPIVKTKGDAVCSGTVVQSGFLKVQTTCDYQSSTVFRISQLVAEAQSKSSKTEEMINKFAKYYTPLVLLVAALIFLIPLILYKTTTVLSMEDFNVWTIRALTVLLIACPCAIVMAAPIASVCSITTAARMAVLIKGGKHLENLAKLNLFVFDKTGTLTEGRFVVVKEYVIKTDVLLRDDIMMLAASLETKSSHPLSASIVNHYSGCLADKVKELGPTMGLPEVTNFKNQDGMGLTGTINQHSVCVGNTDLMAKFDINVDEKSVERFKMWSSEGCTVIFIGVDGKLEMMLGISDKVRDTARAAITTLQNDNIDCMMLTGDNQGAAEIVQYNVGINNCRSGMKPQDKSDWIINAQSYGKKRNYIGMVGDGVNDSPSLAAADVGIAIGLSGSAIAVESAGISLMTHDLTKIVDVIKLGKYCRKIVWQNIFLAISIKTVFVIIAAVGKNLLWMAILSDVLGLLLVILNGLRPLRWKDSTTIHDFEEVTIQDKRSSSLISLKDIDDFDVRFSAQSYDQLTRKHANEIQLQKSMLE